MNDLKEKLKGIGTITELARATKRAPSSISRAIRGERSISFDFALDVERATAGRLSAEEFLKLCLRAYRARRQKRAGASGREGDGAAAADERG